MNLNDSSIPPEPWQVICLCAQWCEVCREWRDLFDQVAAAHPQLRFAWIDIEDEADAVGEVDIETFPTLLIAQGAEPRFYGPVQPSRGQFDRLLERLLVDAGAGAPIAGEAGPLLRRLVAALAKK